jgi:hypothetical protein
VKAKVVRLRRVARTMRETAAAYDAGLVETTRRAVRVVRRNGFTLEEARTLGILDPNAPVSDLGLMASRKQVRPLQHRLNPDDAASLTEDKAVFQRTCELLGLPVPRLYATFYARATGLAADGGVLAGRDAWLDFLRTRLPDVCVVKPVRGHLGLLVRPLRRDGERFADGSGAAVTAAELYDWLGAQRAPFKSFMFQERLAAHPSLVELSGTETLQTIRAITLVSGTGSPGLLFASQKIVTGGAPIDNLHDGQTGNAVAEIELATGRLVRVAGPDSRARRLVELELHPVTQTRLAGFEVPFWQETRALLTRAAEAFMPLRTIGWDIAATPAGPVLLEGNAWWGPAPPNFLRASAPILRALEHELRGIA